MKNYKYYDTSILISKLEKSDSYFKTFSAFIECMTLIDEGVEVKTAIKIISKEKGISEKTLEGKIKNKPEIYEIFLRLKLYEEQLSKKIFFKVFRDNEEYLKMVDFIDIQRYTKDTLIQQKLMKSPLELGIKTENWNLDIAKLALNELAKTSTIVAAYKKFETTMESTFDDYPYRQPYGSNAVENWYLYFSDHSYTLEGSKMNRNFYRCLMYKTTGKCSVKFSRKKQTLHNDVFTFLEESINNYRISYNKANAEETSDKKNYVSSPYELMANAKMAKRIDVKILDCQWDNSFTKFIATDFINDAFVDVFEFETPLITYSVVTEEVFSKVLNITELENIIEKYNIEFDFDDDRNNNDKLNKVIRYYNNKILDEQNKYC